MDMESPEQAHLYETPAYLTEEEGGLIIDLFNR
jgi:hypothetical protein